MDYQDYQAAFDAQHASLPFSGALCIYENGQPVFTRACGLANHAAGLHNTLDTRFGTASGTKAFTATAVCQLVAQGKLGLDTRLKDVLSADLPNFDPAVTIHHLLCHTAGTPDYFDEEVEDDYEALWKERPMYAFRRPADFLPLFQHGPMKFGPGQRFGYNNAGYILLGLVVEQVSGMDFTTYIQQNVFKPAGMEHSGYFPLDALPAPSALGYTEAEPGRFRANIYSVPIIGGADGGAFTTLSDMARFWDALRSGRLLASPLLELMFHPHVQTEPDAPQSWYGYGLWITRQEDKIQSYAIIGEDPGVTCYSTYFPASGRLFTLLGNLVPNAWAMVRALRPLLLSE
jgi:CubicO group peptidase (beta-lactamase class C family)